MRPVLSSPSKGQLYGRQWRYARANYLVRYPYCVMCQREGKVVAAKHVDHIEKHHGDLQLFWDEGNWQGLCEHHHNSVKQAEEKSGRLIGVDSNGRPTHPRHAWNRQPQVQQWGFSIPHGIRRARIPVHLVCGPPGSGKSTYVRQHAEPHDIVIDWDDIRRECGAERDSQDELKLKRAFHKRAQLIDSLAYARAGEGWLIVCAPTKEERRQWCAALGNVTVHSMDVPQDVCRTRIMNDETRADTLEHSLQTLEDYVAAQQNDRNL